MSIVTASATTGTGVPITNSVRTQYQSEYDQEVYFSRFYDQLAVPMAGDMSRLIEGSSVQVNFLSKMDIGTSAISEVVDITPQALTDATTSVTPVSRGEAIQISQQIEIQNFLQNFMGKLTKMVAENAAESIDVLARDVALKGSLVSRTAARASLDAGTTGHRMTESKFASASSTLGDLKAPMFTGVSDAGPSAAWGAFMDPFVFGDLRQDGSVKAVGEYQQGGIHLNYELGRIGPFRLVVNSWAKIFYGAGADQDIIVATTTSSTASKLDTNIKVAAITHFANVESARAWINIGTEETGSTHYPDNERVKTAGYTGSTVTIVGQAPNGGLRFDHALGAAVRNADSVHNVIFGGPGSIVKLYAPEVGEFGQIVGPKRDGIVDQFWTLGWKFWGGYGRVAENRLLREEVSVSDESLHGTT
jgi:N4-gp56 family major capsid protein